MKTKHCPRCDSHLPIEDFYQRRDSSGVTCYCRACLKAQYNERHMEFKQRCVDYKGGKCNICNYKRCLSALDFHHYDPKQKEFVLSHRKNRKDWDAIKKELDKCVLVCSNCHREIHEGITECPMPRAGIEPTS